MTNLKQINNNDIVLVTRLDEFSVRHCLPTTHKNCNPNSSLSDWVSLVNVENRFFIGIGSTSHLLLV